MAYRFPQETDSLSAPPTPKEIALSVRRPAALQLAQQNLTTLRGQRDEIAREYDLLFQGPIQPRPALINAVRERKSDTDSKIGAARREAATLQTEYGDAVRAALRPTYFEAQVQFQMAKDDMIAAWRRMGEIAVVVSEIDPRPGIQHLPADTFLRVAKDWFEKATEGAP